MLASLMVTLFKVEDVPGLNSAFEEAAASEIDLECGNASMISGTYLINPLKNLLLNRKIVNGEIF